MIIVSGVNSKLNGNIFCIVTKYRMHIFMNGGVVNEVIRQWRLSGERS